MLAHMLSHDPARPDTRSSGSCYGRVIAHHRLPDTGWGWMFVITCSPQALPSLGLVAQFAYRLMCPFPLLAHFTHAISAIPMAEQRFMTERSKAIGPRETAKDTDVDFRHLSIGIS